MVVMGGVRYSFRARDLGGPIPAPRAGICFWFWFWFWFTESGVPVGWVGLGGWVGEGEGGGGGGKGGGKGGSSMYKVAAAVLIN